MKDKMSKLRSIITFMEDKMSKLRISIITLILISKILHSGSSKLFCHKGKVRSGKRTKEMLHCNKYTSSLSSKRDGKEEKRRDKK